MAAFSIHVVGKTIKIPMHCIGIKINPFLSLCGFQHTRQHKLPALRLRILHICIAFEHTMQYINKLAIETE